MLLITDKIMSEHEMGSGHPESPERWHSAMRALSPYVNNKKLSIVAATAARPDALQPAHSLQYIEKLYALAPQEGYVSLDPDTIMNSSSLSAALYAAGSGLIALESIVKQQNAAKAFCLTRPPGHHAEHDQAMGFCLLNNIAICALQALTTYRLNKIAIIDFDVHHGNGTENIIAGNQAIQFYSSFQHPFYPGSGVPASAKNIFNYPLSAGSSGNDFLALWSSDIEPRIKRFSPDIILVSAGFDAHIKDPLAQLNFTSKDYFVIGKYISKLAKEVCNDRVISFLEGGYELQALGEAVEQYCLGLLE